MVAQFSLDAAFDQWMWHASTPGPAGTCELHIAGSETRETVIVLTFDAVERSRLIRITVDPEADSDGRPCIRLWLGDAAADAFGEPTTDRSEVDIEGSLVARQASNLGDMARLLDDLEELLNADVGERDLLRSIAGLELLDRTLSFEADAGCERTGSIDAVLNSIERQVQRIGRGDALAKYYDQGDGRRLLRALVDRVREGLAASPCDHHRSARALPLDRLSGKLAGHMQPLGAAIADAAEAVRAVEGTSDVRWDDDRRRAHFDVGDPERGTLFVGELQAESKTTWRVDLHTSSVGTRLWILLFDSTQTICGAWVGNSEATSFTIETDGRDVADAQVGTNKRRVAGERALDVLRRAVGTGRAAAHAEGRSPAVAASLWWQAAHDFTAVEAFARAAAAFERSAALTDDSDADEARRSRAEATVWTRLATVLVPVVTPSDPFVWERLRT